VSALRAALLNCTLKRGDEPSSTDALLGEVAEALEHEEVECSPPVRIVDRDVAPGVRSDEGPGDDWPAIRAQILAADIFVLGTPIWLGHPASPAQRVLERLDAFLGETDERGRMISYDRVAIVAVVGNEDGAHHVAAELFQGLNDVGFAIPPNGVTYWVGEAMQSTDYRELIPRPKKTAETTGTAARNAAHLARMLREHPLPDGRR
jgi:multimeric flavodoxin WrbA